MRKYLYVNMKKYLFCILAALCLFPSLAYAGSAVPPLPFTTDDLPEGGANKYYTDGRVDTRIDARIGSSSVNALSDVTVVSPATGQVLEYNGSGWINGTTTITGNYLAVWKAQGTVGTGTLNLVTDGFATSSASYDGNGNGTVTIKTLPRIFFTATNTTWVVPAGVQVIFVDMVGGGAGGAGGGRGSSNEGGRGGGGGGSGEAFIDFPILVQPGQSFNITIGTGGNAGVGAIFPSSSAANGGNGGDSSFGNYLTAKGGSGGTAGGDGPSAPGVGGAGGDGGSLYYDGFDGYSGSTAGASSESPGGNGARSKFGLPGTSTGGGIGLSGVGYGSGGGGGQGGAISGNGYSGGTGTAGFCVIKF